MGDLQGKSEVLQGTSSAFSNQARRLQWEMRWRRYRLWLVVCLPILWVVCTYALRERGEKLQDLQGKSEVLQGTSSAFSNQARRLQWEMRWRRYRLWLVVCLPILWVV